MPRPRASSRTAIFTSDSVPYERQRAVVLDHERAGAEHRTVRGALGDEDLAARSDDESVRIVELEAVARLDDEVPLDPLEVQVAERGAVRRIVRTEGDDREARRGELRHR